VEGGVGGVKHQNGAYDVPEAGDCQITQTTESDWVIIYLANSQLKNQILKLAFSRLSLDVQTKEIMILTYFDGCRTSSY
jgi:hypothetical protein